MLTKCPACQKKLKFPDHVSGDLKCSFCGNIFYFSGARQTARYQKMKSEPTKMYPQRNPGILQNVTTEKQENFNELLKSLDSAKHDINQAFRDRDEAMELVDQFFQMFLERADNPEIPFKMQQEYREIAQKIFQLQRKFPLLSGVRDTLVQCEGTFRRLLKT